MTAIETDIGRALGTDYFLLRGGLTEDELDYLDRTRGFVEEESVALETTARREGDEYVIDGAKRWIGNGSLAEVVVLWARDVADGQVKGFLVEHGTPGYEAHVIEGEGSVRSVWQAHIELIDTADVEPIHTFEGTETIQRLIVGRDITGLSEFA